MEERVMRKKVLALIVAVMMMMFPAAAYAGATVDWDDGTSTTVEYTDVNDGDWYVVYVAAMQDIGLMTGVNAETFLPAGTLSRAQFATILYRMAGSPEGFEYQEGTFPDVTENYLTSWYMAPVQFAYEYGLITGYTNTGNFGPEDNITREQLVTILYRFTQMIEMDNGKRADLSQFPDGSMVTGFAQEAMSWAIANELISGDNGNLNPQGNAQRSHCAAILYRYYLSMED